MCDKQKEELVVKIDGAILIARPSADPMYPGICIDIKRDEMNCEESVLLVETINKGNEEDDTVRLRTLLWQKDKEDYSHEILRLFKK